MNKNLTRLVLTALFAAVPSIGSNMIQGGTCLVLGLAATLILESTKSVNQIKKYV